MSFFVRCLDLSLGWRKFLDHDSGHRLVASSSICSFSPLAAANIESHSNSSLGNSSAVSSNLRNFVNVGTGSSVVFINIHHAINRETLVALCTFEGKKPTRAAVETTSDSCVTIIIYFQGCVIGHFE